MGAKKESLSQQKSRMAKILGILKKTYPDAHCALTHKNAFELICATILSAQCTDERVNKVTPSLFKAYPDAASMARAPLPKVEKLVQSTGFFRNKAKSLVECAKAVVEKHGGEVPNTMDDLVKLRGVGRKTANVVLGNVFGIPSLVVDTHVGRLCRRFGFTKSQDPVKVEHEMMEIVPKEDWTLFSHLLIFHGRNRCDARKPDCEHCEVADLCPKNL